MSLPAPKYFAALLVLVIQCAGRAALETDEPNFPILSALFKQRFRLQYELIGESLAADGQSEFKSVLVDEAFSWAARKGRILNYRGAESSDESGSPEAFYWMLGEQDERIFRLRPFSCASTTMSHNTEPFRCELIQSLFPAEVEQFTVHANLPGTRLVGLSGVLANVAADTRTERVVGDSLGLKWRLKPAHDILLEFIWPLAGAKRGPETNWNSTEHLIGLQVKIFIGSDLRTKITLLRADQLFSDHILLVPLVYDCSSFEALELPERLKGLDDENKFPASGEYTIELSVTRGSTIPTGSDETAQRSLSAFQKDFELHEPIDTMRDPLTHFGTLRFIHDSIQMLTAIDTSGELLVWMPEKLQSWQVNKENGTCVGPTRVDAVQKVGASCEQSLVEFRLSPDVTLKLNEEGLELMRFEVPKSSYLASSQTITLDTGSEATQLTYRIHRPPNICIYHRSKLLSSSNALQISRLIVPEVRQKTAQLNATSLFFFEDSTFSRLLLQVDLKLLELEPFRPWKASRHPLDLSACADLSPEQSANLILEYPLDKSLAYMRAIADPEELIRGALASHFRHSYQMSLLRIPSMEITIGESLLRAELNLLDRSHLIEDSDPVKLTTDASRVSSDHLKWLADKASGSIITSSLRLCAEYCELHLCSIYLHCDELNTCFTYDKTTASLIEDDEQYRKKQNENPSVEHRCQARQVREDREASGLSKSWSLEEVLENVQDLVEDRNERDDRPLQIRASKPLISVVAKGSTNHPSSRLLRLEPNFVHFYYPAVVGAPLEHNGEQSDSALGAVSHFQLFRFAVRFDTPDTHLVHKNAPLEEAVLDLDATSGGYLVFEEHSLQDCSSLCLNQAGCTSFSYCQSGNTVCTLTNVAPTQLAEMISGSNSGQAKDTGVFTLKVVAQEDCSIMKRNFLDQFEVFDQFRATVNNLTSATGSSADDDSVIAIFDAANAETCAFTCLQERVDKLAKRTCLSFDFCQLGESNSGKCVLLSIHLVSECSDFAKCNKLPTVLDQSDEKWSCKHHVRRFGGDFRKLNRRKLSQESVAYSFSNLGEWNENLIVKPDLSHSQCERTCAEDPNCGAFDYCVSFTGQSQDLIHLSCSMGNNLTLESSSDQLVRIVETERLFHKCTVCSVYSYKSSAPMLKRKKRYLISTSAETKQETVTEPEAALYTSKSATILDAILFISSLFVSLLILNERNGRGNLLSFRRVLRRSNIESTASLKMELEVRAPI